MIRMLTCFVLTLAAPVWLTAQASATANLRRAINAVTDRLFASKALDCKFAQGTFARWLGPFDRGSDSMAALEPDSKPFVLTFANIDTLRHTATLVGNNGSGPIGVFTSGPGLTFFDRTPVGYFTLTTVFATYANGTNA